jgi:hypothetical protein
MGSIAGGWGTSIKFRKSRIRLKWYEITVDIKQTYSNEIRLPCNQSVTIS